MSVSNWWTSNPVPMVIVLLGAIISACGAALSSLGQARSEAETEKRNKQVMELNETIKQAITGGDSFCFVTFGPYKNPDDSATLMLMHSGLHTLYDIHVRVVEDEAFEEGLRRGESPLLAGATSYTPGNLAASTAQPLELNFRLPAKGEAKYNVIIYARNGCFYEEVRLKKVNGLWLSAYRVRLKAGEPEEKILFERVEPDYPRTNGQVDWL